MGVIHVRYGAGAVDVVRLLADHLLLAHSRAAFMRPLSRVELAIAEVKTCSDFRLTSHVSYNRTKCALQLRGGDFFVHGLRTRRRLGMLLSRWALEGSEANLTQLVVPVM